MLERASQKHFSRKQQPVPGGLARLPGEPSEETLAEAAAASRELDNSIGGIMLGAQRRVDDAERIMGGGGGLSMPGAALGGGGLSMPALGPSDVSAAPARDLSTALRDPETGTIYVHDAGTYEELLEEMRAGSLGEEGIEAADRIGRDLDNEEVAGFVGPDDTFLARTQTGQAFHGERL